MSEKISRMPGEAISPSSISENKLLDDERRSPEEIRRVMKQISWLSRVFSGRYDLKIAALDGEGPWTCGIDPEYAQAVDAYICGKIDNLDHLPPQALVPNLITFRKNDLYRDPEIEITRKTRHEAAHAAHSDFKFFFQGMRLAKEQGFLPSTYGSLLNGPEDGWVNAMSAGESQAALEDLKRGYLRKLKEIATQIPHDPLPRQFGVNAINYWLTGQDLPSIDERVQAVMDKVRPALDRFYASKSALENFHTFSEEIWPQVRDLEKEEVEDQVKRNMAQQAMEGRQGNEGQDGRGGSGQPQLPEDLKQKIKQEMQQGSQSSSQSKQSQSGRQSGLQSSQQSEGQSSAQPDEQRPGSQGENPETSECEMDLNELSTETREQLEFFLKNLNPQALEKLEEDARKQTDQKQSEKLNKEAPQMIQMEQDEETGEFKPKIQTADQKEVEKAQKELEEFEKEEQQREQHDIQQQQAEQQKQEAKQKAREQKERKLREMREAGFREDEEGNYDRYKELEREMMADFRSMDQQVMKAFPREWIMTQQGYFYSGRPDARQAARKFPVGDSRFNTRKDIELSQKIETFIWFVIDITGSMHGAKLDESLKDLILWMMLCEKYNIPSGIITMGSNSSVLKNPNQPFSSPEQRIKAKLIAQTKSLHGSTNYEAGVVSAYEQLLASRRRFPGSQGVIMFLTDGEPNSGLTGQPLVEKIDEIKKVFELFAFGLSNSRDEKQRIKAGLDTYFGEDRVIIPENMGQLTIETRRVMTPILRRIGQRLRQGQ